MVKIEDAIKDLKENIEFIQNDKTITTQGEIIILLESKKLNEEKLNTDKKKLAEFIIRNCHSCPIPVNVTCKKGFQLERCVECLLKHIDTLCLTKE